MKSDFLVISTKVEDAIRDKLPVIAIDTAGIYLGLSEGGFFSDTPTESPDLAKIAENVEKLIIQNGAIPALVAVIDGKIHIGLNREKREYLRDHVDELRRVSRRDLPLVLAMPADGATTVSATMMAAHLAGIQVVVTVGIGGVSDDYAESMDVSTDLRELTQNQIVLVSSGVNPGSHPKKTLEYLETHGVPVMGFRSDKYYTGWRDETENPVHVRVDEPTDIARVHAVKRSLDILGSMLVINSPSEKGSAAECFDARRNTQGFIELLHDNATLGAWIAVAISMDLDPNIQNKNSRRANQKKKEKSMSFEVWLFSVKGFAQNFDVAQLIFNNLPDSEKERLRQEYEDTVD